MRLHEKIWTAVALLGLAGISAHRALAEPDATVSPFDAGAVEIRNPSPHSDSDSGFQATVVQFEATSGSGPSGTAAPEVWIVVSKNGRHLWGYSSVTGKWIEQPIQHLSSPPIPILGSGVAGVVHGQYVYGFSGWTGTWAALALPDGSRPEPIVGGETVRVESPRSLSIFSVRTATWATLTLPEE